MRQWWGVPTPSPITDPILGRPHRKLRISVTDRCAFRCTYCVPDDAPAPLPRSGLLSFEEITRFVADAAAPCGLTRLRLTGGEPLQRRGLPDLVAMLRAVDGVVSLGLTTNGARLAKHAAALRAAGLDGVNISLDTLRRDRFEALARVDRLPQVLDGIDAAAAEPFGGRKLNCVPIRGVNDDELPDLVAFGAARGFDVRFIEFMPFGSRWSPDQVIDQAEILAAIEARFGPAVPEPWPPGETARTWRLPGLGQGARFGIIPTASQPFCAHCDRVRLSADGRLLPCLFATGGVDVRALLRAGAPPTALRAALAESLAGKGLGYLASRASADVQEPGVRHDMRGIGG